MTAARDIDALRVAIEAYERAEAECARLTQPDDYGSGERTARLAALGAWETARARALDAVEAAAGTYDLEAARALLIER